MLAGLDGFKHQLFCDAVAAYEFDHDIDVGVGHNLASIVHHLHVRPDSRLGARHVEVGDHGDLNPAPGAAADFFLVALEHFVGAAAHGAYAQKAYTDGAQIRRFHSR